MCGLIGTLGFIPSQIKRDRGLAALHRRGPDSRAEVLGADFWVAHSLLAIRSQGSGPIRQPAVDHGRRIATAYNGELYTGADGQAVSSAETEARAFSAAAFRALRGSAEGLNRLEGDFALVAVQWDSSGFWQRALLARDDMGIKPLYVAHTTEGIAFSSTVKALVAAGLVDPVVDADAISHYLLTGSIPQPMSALRNVSSVEPGQRIVLHVDGKSSLQKWRRRIVLARPGFLDSALASVRSQCADVVGRGEDFQLFLSGGVDSMLLGHLASKAGARVRGYCLSLGDGKLDESAAAAASARALGIPLDVVRFDADAMAGRCVDFLTAVDQPTIDGLNAFLVFAGANLSGRVIFTGTGLDELYFGYEWIVALLRFYKGREQPSVNALAREWEERTSYVRREHVEALTGRPLSPAYLQSNDPGPRYPLAHRLREICLRRFTADRLLRDLDEVSMYHSREARVPFLGRSVVTHAIKSNFDRLFPRGLDGKAQQYETSSLKQLVVDVAAQVLPKGSLVGRRKQGFVLPLDTMLTGPLAERLALALCPSRSPAASLVDLDRLQTLRHQRAEVGTTFLDWSVLGLSEWLRSTQSRRHLTPPGAKRETQSMSIICEGSVHEAD